MNEAGYLTGGLVVIDALDGIDSRLTNGVYLESPYLFTYLTSMSLTNTSEPLTV